jgi:hypothetical protein
MTLGSKRTEIGFPEPCIEDDSTSGEKKLRLGWMVAPGITFLGITVGQML